MDNDKLWFLKSSFPVDFPSHQALTVSRPDFEAFVAHELECHQRDRAEQGLAQDGQDGDDTVTDGREDRSKTFNDKSKTSTHKSQTSSHKPKTSIRYSNPFSALTDSTTVDVRQHLDTMQVDDADSDTSSSPENTTGESPFMQGLLQHAHEEPKAPDMTNRMFTNNNDLAYRSTDNALVDLFYELEVHVSGPRLRELLEASWKEDPLITLKIIFNARSIHLGKGSRRAFYRAAGWLAQNHPLTLVANLRWLTRPVIGKKMKNVPGEEDMVFVESGKPDDDDDKYDMKYGVAHGYWKDLPNLLALGVNNSLTVFSEPRKILNSENPGMSRGRVVPEARKEFRRRHGIKGRVEKPGSRGNREAERKKTRHMQRDSRHEAAVRTFTENRFYRALHLTIARLFADQLAADLKALREGNNAAKRGISLCGKWAPSSKNFHDRHTFLVSSIAEIMHPRSTFDESLLPSAAPREMYLRWARDKYRQDVSSLRKHLEIVERKLTSKDYEAIDYEAVPSLAMSAYTSIFIERDFDRFDKYIDKVALGEARISGATLLPSTLISKVRDSPSSNEASTWGARSRKQLVEMKKRHAEGRVCDAQWNTLVQRIKDSGTLSSSMAVCDVSGSMQYPRFDDGTTPMDAAIGLSLLMAEVVEPPFGGAFITFHSSPSVIRVDLKKSLPAKYQYMKNSRWAGNTNLVATFEQLILPMAIKHNIKPEDMVKRIFVFSDMHFDGAVGNHQDGSRRSSAWTSAYERIKGLYEKARYEMPELVFWNLAGDRSSAAVGGDPTAPKPALADEPGVAMVSGYSQGMLKVFMDGGGFDGEDEEEAAVVVSKDGEEITAEDKEREKKKMDALAIMNKAVGHKAYDMLKVLD